jgi:hypothetical protein
MGRNHALQARSQAPCVVGFDQQAVDPGRNDFLDALSLGLGGDHQKGKVGQLGVSAYRLEQLQPGHYRHVPVRQNGIELATFEHVHGLSAIAGHLDSLEAHASQLVDGDRAHQLHVIDHEKIELMQVHTQRAGDNMAKEYHDCLAGPGMMAA